MVTLKDALRSYAQSADTLSVQTGLSEREIRHEVRELRQQGYGVCSGDDGYFVTSDINDIERCANRLIAHGRHEIEIARAMLERAKLLGQLEMKI